MSTRSGTPTFAAIVPAEAIFVLSLDEVAIVILNSLRNVRSDAVLSAHVQTSNWARSYPKDLRRRVEMRLTEAWQLLHQRGLIAETRVLGIYEGWFVTEKGHSVTEASQLSLGSIDLLPKALLVQRLVDTAEPLFLAGRFDEACAAAFKQLEIAVRELSGAQSDVVGLELMRQAFKPTIGPLTDETAPMAEQLGARDLFMGAIGYYRNPLAHRHVGISDARHAASVILLANELIVTAVRHARAKAVNASERIDGGTGSS